jgi:hypothetical protein
VANQAGKLIFVSDDDELGLGDHVADEMIFGSHAASQFGRVEEVRIKFPANPLADESWGLGPRSLVILCAASPLDASPSSSTAVSGTAHLRQGYGAGTCPLHATQPKTHAAFWRKKIATNRTRDRLVTRTLRTCGWRVLRIWEHELKRRNEMQLARRILRALALTHDHAGLASAA